MTRSIIALTLASFALAAPVLSQAQATPSPATQGQSADKPADKADKGAMASDAFKRADANQDGKLSKDEAAKVPSIAAKFDELDKDKDGSLSASEFAAGAK